MALPSASPAGFLPTPLWLASHAHGLGKEGTLANDVVKSRWDERERNHLGNEAEKWGEICVNFRSLKILTRDF